jgi:hypothetical protein
MSDFTHISTKDAQEILLATGEWGGIVLAAESAETPAALRGLCVNVRDTIRQSLVIRMDDPVIHARTAAALDALVQASLLSAETKAALIALAQAGNAGGSAPTVRLVKGHPVPRSAGLVVLNTGEYKLDELVECARPDAPNQSYGAILCSMIVEGE